ncbi:MAG TPA: hypothetical protein DCG69_05855 [Bacteroidales bacterium]|nr:hypothetical protein [Bacteroidales bacterium]
MTLNYSKFVERFSFYSLLFFVFWLPLFEGFLPTVFGIWIGFWVLEGNFKSRFRKFNFTSGLNLAFFAYFLLSLFAVLYSSNQAKAWMDVQQKLALLVFPLLIGGLSEYSQKNIRWAFWAFILGLIAASIYDLAYAFQESINAGANEGVFRYWVYEKHHHIGFLNLVNLRMSFFSYGYLSQFMHPSYFSMYLIFAIILLYHLYKTKENTTALSILLYASLTLFFTLLIGLLQSTAGLLSFIALILAVIVIEFKFLNRKRILAISVGLLAMLILGFFGSDFSGKKINDLTDTTLESLSTSTSIRMEIWKNSIALWKENPIRGVGPADVRADIQEKLQTTMPAEFEFANFNMHNQFLESLIGLGIIGFITLCLILFYIIKIASRQKNSLLAYLILIILVNFIFESMLNRQSGLFFILFFVSLLELYFKQNFLPKKSNIPT